MRLIRLIATSAVLSMPILAQTSPATGIVSSQSSAQTLASEDPELKEDLQKMRTILNQMRTNLAFVGSTTTPLAHQFQLEIDMWQALIDQLERREQKKAGETKGAQ
jgi:hypothetical protein